MKSVLAMAATTIIACVAERIQFTNDLTRGDKICFLE